MMTKSEAQDLQRELTELDEYLATLGNVNPNEDLDYYADKECVKSLARLTKYLKLRRDTVELRLARWAAKWGSAR